MQERDAQIRRYEESLKQLDSESQTKAQLQLQINSLENELLNSKTNQEKLLSEAATNKEKVMQHQVRTIRKYSQRNLRLPDSRFIYHIPESLTLFR